MIGLMPAEVDSIDRERRIVKIRIPGLTDGATDLPEAQLCLPMGDKSEHTEIRIKVDDRVWIAFEGADTRYPVIVGYRPRNQENGIDWRRFEHANFNFNADNKFEVIAGTQVHVTAPSVLITSAESHFTGAVTVDGLLTYKAGLAGTGGAAGNVITGAFTQSGGALSSNGKVLHTHTHTDPQGGTTGAPS